MTQQEKDDLLAEAKRRYPIGTKFISEFDDSGAIREIYPFDLNKGVSFEFEGDNIRIENGISISRTYGCSNPLIYKNGKWAEIVSKPEEKKKYTISELKYPIAIHITSKEQYDKVKELDIPEYDSGYNYYLVDRGKSKTKYEDPAFLGRGNYINIEFEDIIFPEEINKDQPTINTYGLKVGDTLRADILNKWGNSGNFLHEGSTTFKESGMFRGDRILDSFYNSPAGVIFKPSGCALGEFGLKAEGFKEFMDNFDKPMNQRVVYSEPMKQELTSLPKKWVLKEDKPKFEVSKWYKFKAFSNERDYYAKVAKLDSTNSFWASDFIPYKNADAKNYIGGKFDRVTDCTLLTDLSEIQQYLPEGHPDKVMYKTGYDPYVKSTTTSNLDLSNTKIWIGNNPGLSEKVQKKAFELGWKWNSGSIKCLYTDQCIGLIFNEDKYISKIQNNGEYFNMHKNKQIFPSDLGITSNPCAEIVLKPKIEYLNLEFNGKAFCPQQDLLSLQENDGRIDPSITKTKSIKTELVSEQSIILF